MTFTKIPKELLAVYEATEYWVFASPAPFVLTIGQHSAPLAHLIKEANCECAAFISAHNPMSEPRSADANAEAHARLWRMLAKECARVVAGAGRDPTGHWPEEQSLLAVGLELEAARRIGERFEQNAIVWTGADAVPQLVLLR